MHNNQSIKRGYTAFVKSCMEEHKENLETFKMLTEIWNELKENQEHLSHRFDPVSSKLNTIRYLLGGELHYHCPHCKSSLKSEPIYDEKGCNNYDGCFHHILSCPKCNYKFAKTTPTSYE